MHLEMWLMDVSLLPTDQNEYTSPSHTQPLFLLSLSIMIWDFIFPLKLKFDFETI